VDRLNFGRITAETIAQAKALMADSVKTITTATGLTGYSLEAPAKKLYPVLTPLRNRINRDTARAMGATATNWKQITGINTANLKVGVAFGTRNSEISYATGTRVATFKSYGLDDSVQDEAIWMGRNFEDVRAFSALATLQAMMIGEEDLILGGMDSSSGAAFGTTGLGTPGTPTNTAGTGGSITAGTYYVSCLALPYYGARFSSVGVGVDAAHSAASPNSASSVTSAGTQSLSGTVAPVAGAHAYAWFVGGTAATGQTLAAITFINSYKITSIPGTQTLATAGTADASGRSVDFDGLLAQVWGGTSLTSVQALTNGTLYTSANSAPIIVMNTGTAGTGTGLTADNAGGIAEFDALLQYLWDNVRLGPQRVLVSGQDVANITKKIAASTGLVYRIGLQDGDTNLVGGVKVRAYLNKFTGDEILIETHPTVPKGTIIFETDLVPYPNSQVPNVLEMEVLQEYALFEWARTQRNYPHGVYANAVLKHYFPAAFGMIVNVANA
jgi:hypothetical protein